MPKVIKKFENAKVKVTVEEKSEFEFIATLWSKDFEHEEDRRVYEYETFGGACACAFEMLCGHISVVGAQNG